MNVEQYNRSYLEKISNFLNDNPRALTKDLVNRMRKEILDEEEAIIALLSSILNLTKEETVYYLRPGLKKLKKEVYTKNEYYQNIEWKEKKYEEIELCYEKYEPYEIFVYNDLVKEKDGRIIPQLGYFTEEYKYPCIKEKDREWMLITPNEIETMKEPIQNANGKVLTFGLGLGYFLYQVSNKKEVESVTVIENNKKIIELFKKELLPQFPNKNKIKIIEADAYEYSRKIKDIDYVFIDIYHDVSDGIDNYIYFKLLEKKEIKYDYWIEKSIQCYF